MSLIISLLITVVNGMILLCTSAASISAKISSVTAFSSPSSLILSTRLHMVQLKCKGKLLHRNCFTMLLLSKLSILIKFY